MRTVLQAVIENARVTNPTESLALRLDPYIVRAGDLQPYERVEVINGRERYSTWIEPGVEGSGEVHFNARIGDVIAIVAYTDLHEGQTIAHQPKIVTLDAKNRVTSVILSRQDGEGSRST